MKFEYEVLDPGAIFDFRLELVIREKDNPEKMKYELKRLLSALINEEIRIGAKTSRGLGKIKLLPDNKSLSVLLLNFNDSAKKKQYLKKWLTFDWDNFKGNIIWNKLSNAKDSLKSTHSCKLTAVLNIPGSVMIRSYNYLSGKVPGSDITGEPDYTHIKSGNSYVIPGTSWTGSLRSQSKRILVKLLSTVSALNPVDIAEELLCEVYGFVRGEQYKNDKDNETLPLAMKSFIQIDDSIIMDSKLLRQTRVKIDRYTGGAVESALFTSEPLYKGKTNINIYFKPIKDHSINWAIGLSLLALKDLSNGFMAVGGETAIGRGIFNVEKVSLDGKVININSIGCGENNDFTKYIIALTDKVSQAKEGCK